MDEARARMTPAELVNAVERFIQDNERSNGLDNRWLASELVPILAISRVVRNGNRMEPDIKKRIDAFRAGEIDKEIAEHTRQLDALERDLKTLRRSDT